KQIAVLPIDPSSPFSGGAVLGDRVRMTDHFRDAGVYIRSLSTRGSHGGLSRAAREIVRVLDAFGHDLIIVETVGVGQTELSVMDLAHTTVVAAIAKHRAWLSEHRDPVRESDRRQREFTEVLTAELEELAARALGNGAAGNLLAQVREGRLNPYSAARTMTAAIAKLLPDRRT